MKKKTFLSIVIFLLITITTSAQTSAKQIFVELGGPGIASLNYDMRLMKKEDGIGFRVGVGGYSYKIDLGFGSYRTSLFTLPVALNYLLGKDQRNYFEI